ncbi:hypothetical protein AMOR_16190 [Anaeromyxobacter oryzae]|uniref:Uncharacterized protein n=1 Tax=Anaeromyxobacter oryzae TaxID=2918170 RepID=A0ABN6MT73_9BACT|nr:hypothetical protein AMOR_16190 [Anaeromyxobacter oryzae]
MTSTAIPTSTPDGYGNGPGSTGHGTRVTGTERPGHVHGHGHGHGMGPLASQVLTVSLIDANASAR